MARPCIAKKQVEFAWREKAEYVSHGSTGKGNDQVRFELCYLGMDPNLKCVTLWREPEYLAKFEGRQDLLDYASSHNIPVSQTKKHSYSEDENIMHISYESGELEDPAYPGVVTEYPGLVLKKKTQDLMDTPDEPCRLEIDFDNGAPIAVREHDASGNVTNATGEDPLALFAKLNELAGIHGVGRIDIVENRYVGMKSRGCYETPGGTVLQAAHLDLETLTIDREVMRLRDTMSIKFSELVYNGYWFSPEMDFLRVAMDHAQKPVSPARSRSTSTRATSSRGAGRRRTRSTTRSSCRWTRRAASSRRTRRASSRRSRRGSRPRRSATRSSRFGVSWGKSLSSPRWARRPSDQAGVLEAGAGLVQCHVHDIIGRIPFESRFDTARHGIVKQLEDWICIHVRVIGPPFNVVQRLICCNWRNFHHIEPEVFNLAQVTVQMI